MKLILIVALAASVAIPAGFLLGSPYLTQSAAVIHLPAEQDDMPKIGVISPREPIPEIAIEPPKKDVIPRLPEQGRIGEPANQDANQLPKQEVGQPPQQPLQEAPQLPQIVPNVAREGIPEEFVLKGGLLSIQRAQYSQGREAVRMDLTDAILESSPLLKPAFAEYAAKYSAWESNCNRVDPGRVGACRFGEPTFPIFETGITESQLSSLITLLGPITPRESLNRNGDIERQYGAWVVYKESRYLIFINALWGSP